MLPYEQILSLKSGPLLERALSSRDANWKSSLEANRKLQKLFSVLTLLYSQRPKLYTILTFLSAIGLKNDNKNLSLFLSTLSTVSILAMVLINIVVLLNKDQIIACW